MNKATTSRVRTSFVRTRLNLYLPIFLIRSCRWAHDASIRWVGVHAHRDDYYYFFFLLFLSARSDIVRAFRGCSADSVSCCVRRRRASRAVLLMYRFVKVKVPVLRVFHRPARNATRQSPWQTTSNVFSFRLSSLPDRSRTLDLLQLWRRSSQ